MSVPCFPKTSPCMLRWTQLQSGDTLFSLNLNPQAKFTCLNKLQQRTRTTSYLMCGWDTKQSTLCLIHSLSASGGLALRHLSRPLSLHSRHFQRPQNLFSTHAGAPNVQFKAFFSNEESFFSPPPKFLSPARPVLQHTRCWEVCVSLQAARWILFVCTAGFPTFYCVTAGRKLSALPKSPKVR